jgi:hypothetical protein
LLTHADRLGLMDMDAYEEGQEGGGGHALHAPQWLAGGSDEGEDVWMTPLEQGWPLTHSSRYSTPDTEAHTGSLASDQAQQPQHTPAGAGAQQSSPQGSGQYEASPVQQHAGGDDGGSGDDNDSTSSPLRPWGRVGSAAQYLARQLSEETEDRGHMDPHSSAGFSPQRWPQVPAAGSEAPSQDNSPGPS